MKTRFALMALFAQVYPQDKEALLISDLAHVKKIQKGYA
jgi:hypothetical protein